MTTTETAIDPLFDPAMVQEPHEYYRHLRENDPVHEIEGTGTYLVTRMELIHEVVADTDTYSSAVSDYLHLGDWPHPGLRPAMSGSTEGTTGISVATTDPPDHDRQRRVVSRRLSRGSVEALGVEFQQLVVDALSAVGHSGSFEWMSRVAEPLPMVMVTRILGLADDLAPQLKKQGYAMVERIGGFVPEARILELEDEGVNGLTPVIEAYMKAKEDAFAYENGLIGIVKRAVDEGELNDLEAFGILSVIIAAGGESTTSLIGTAARVLAQRVDLQDQLRADPTLIPNFVEEALRYDPPFRGHYRVVTRDTHLGGKSIAAGSHLLLSWPAANRDNTMYDEPDEFRLGRPRPRFHTGFGWGIHLCVGAPLARLEAKVAIETLLAGTRHFSLDPEQPPVRYHPSLVVRRLASLPLLLESA